MSQHVEKELARAFMQSAYRRDDEQASPIGHVIGFWIFLAGAAVLLAGAVFLPIWQDHQHVLAARAETQQRIDALRSELSKLQLVVDQLERDPALNERAALRDLNFFVPGHEVVGTEPADVLATRSSLPAQVMHHPVRRGVVEQFLIEHADLARWAELVSDGDIRRGMLIGAAFLISAAMVLFAPPSPRSARSAVLQPSELEQLTDTAARRQSG